MIVARDGVEPPTPAFSAKNNSDYNDFVVRVALEVVDIAWCKQQLRVKSAGRRKNCLSSNEGDRGKKHKGTSTPSVTADRRISLCDCPSICFHTRSQETV